MAYSTPVPTVIRLASVKSTNEEIKQMHSIQRLADFTVLISDAQSEGKGQVGNKWECEAGKNLTFSILLFPKRVEILNQFILSKMISVAVLQSLECYVSGLSIKWPNDIYLDDKKLGGILIENSIMGATLNQTIIGVGLNINQCLFLSDAPNPISLALLAGKSFDLNIIFSRILDQIALRYGQLNDALHEEINTIYFSNLYRKDGYHKYRDDNGEFVAKITNVLDHGFLVLTLVDGSEREYAFKEVQFIGDEG